MDEADQQHAAESAKMLLDQGYDRDEAFNASMMAGSLGQMSLMLAGGNRDKAYRLIRATAFLLARGTTYIDSTHPDLKRS